MNTVMIVFLKEMKDLLRDRRTIFMMVIIPMLFYPVLMSVLTRVQTSQDRKAREKKLTVALVVQDNAAALRDTLLQRSDLRIRENVESGMIEQQVRNGELDAAIVVSRDFDQVVENAQQGGIDVYFKSSENLNQSRSRVTGILRAYESTLIDQRFAGMGIDRNIGKAVNIRQHDVATQKERAGSIIGGILPLFFVVFCMLGSMYPAIDLGAGEKERKTIETLLSSPARRLRLLAGKLLTVITAGFGSAAIGMLSLYITISHTRALPKQLQEFMSGIMDVQAIIVMLALMAPLAVFFSSLMLCLSFYARSYREAQSLITPLFLLVVLPMQIGMMPGMTLNWTTAFVPVFNVMLTTKAVMAGTMDYAMLSAVFGSLMVLAAGALLFCMHWFQREEVIFRGQ